MNLTAIITSRTATVTKVQIMNDGKPVGTVRCDAVEDGEWQPDSDDYGPVAENIDAMGETLDMAFVDICDEVAEQVYEALAS